MIIYTDDRDYTDIIFPGQKPWTTDKNDADDSNFRELKQRIFPTGIVYKRVNEKFVKWAYAIVVKHAPSSHFDLLVELGQQEKQFPDRTLFLAGSGQRFHGQRKRPWAALEGNIHLTVYLSPRRFITNYHAGLPILAAVSLIDVLDAFEPTKKRGKIKWVNDILIDGAKVAGFLVHTQSLEDTVLTAILGIGLNVEVTPKIKPDPFVPKVACLRDFSKNHCTMDREKVLSQLLQSLDKNYELLLSGQYDVLLDSYRERSIVIGHHVKVMPETPVTGTQEIVAGRVVGIGENLELFLEDRRKPVTSGRLILA